MYQNITINSKLQLPPLRLPLLLPRLLRPPDHLAGEPALQADGRGVQDHQVGPGGIKKHGMKNTFNALSRDWARNSLLYVLPPPAHRHQDVHINTFFKKIFILYVIFDISFNILILALLPLTVARMNSDVRSDIIYLSRGFIKGNSDGITTDGATTCFITSFIPGGTRTSAPSPPASWARTPPRTPPSTPPSAPRRPTQTSRPPARGEIFIKPLLPCRGSYGRLQIHFFKSVLWEEHANRAWKIKLLKCSHSYNLPQICSYVATNTLF